MAGRNGEPLPLRTVYYDRNADREAHLASSLDGMHAYLKYVPGPAFSGLTREKIVAIIAGAGVIYGLIDEGIALFVVTQNGPEPFNGFFEIARGEPMRKGENGFIEFHVQPTSMEARYDSDAGGGIDYKQLNLIENCFVGQRVAFIHPPGPGRSGWDVFGQEIAAQSGEPLQIRPGPGILISSNGRDFTSEVEGRVVFDNDVISISPLLEISRDIDYSIGNVDFVGKVTVKGSLLDGFYINAKRGVELQGDMGAGRITSEGDVKITGGIKGRNAAVITCKSLTVHYIDDATVEASGDVNVTKEIMNSSVKSLGRVTVSNGAIIGGEVVGFQGVEADTLGSDMGVLTWVSSGLNWTEENRKDDIRAQVAEYMDRVQSARVILDALFSDKVITARLGSEQKVMLAELMSELRELRELLVELLEERSRIDSRNQVGMVNQINVKKMLYMGVATRFSAVEGQIKDTVKGPLSIMQDLPRNITRTGPYAELPRLRDPEPEPLPANGGNGTANGNGAADGSANGNGATTGNGAG
ncbi:MAG: FapA family protein [Planctomycetaceae bacterium]|nr:FapA family protein [Planctomycetaceae bacterium]